MNYLCHVIGGLVEVAYSRYVILSRLSDHLSTIGNHYSRVPDDLAVILAISFKYWIHDHHVVAFS